MRARFEILVTLDPAQVELEGKRAGLALERARESVLADIENRLHDAIRFRDGVQRVGVNLFDEVKVS
jgi:hypothetical protein